MTTQKKADEFINFWVGYVEQANKEIASLTNPRSNAMRQQLETAIKKRDEGMKKISDLATQADALLIQLGRLPNLSSKEAIKTVHNCWAVYKSQPLDTGKLWTETKRPQDWGDPKWHYRRVTLGAVINGQVYCNVVHCWVDVEMTDHEALTLFQGLICTVTIMYPARVEQECGNTHRVEDDFWHEAWGKLPPLYEPDHDRSEWEGF